MSCWKVSPGIRTVSNTREALKKFRNSSSHLYVLSSHKLPDSVLRIMELDDSALSRNKNIKLVRLWVPGAGKQHLNLLLETVRSTRSRAIPLALGIQVSLPAPGKLKTFYSQQHRHILPCACLEEHSMVMKMGSMWLLTIKAFVKVLLSYFIQLEDLYKIILNVQPVVYKLNTCKKNLITVIIY